MVVADTKALTLGGEEEEEEARTFLWTRRGGKMGWRAASFGFFT